MENTLIIGGHGLGDCILSLQCASFVKHGLVDVKISTRQEVYDALRFLFGHLFQFKKINEKFSENNALLNNPEFFNELKEGYNNIYYVIPDLLFTNPLAFDYKKFNCSPQVIKSTRLLTNKAIFKPTIYLGLMTTTSGYLYQSIPDLAVGLAKALPDYSIYLPLLSKWAGKEIPKIEIKDAPINLHVAVDEPFNFTLDVLRESCYFIGTDNGPSHVAYHYGIPRLILDPQYGKLPWIARWKEDVTESIPINVHPQVVINTVKTNLEIPATTLIPRGYVASNLNMDWKQSLYLKF